MAANRIQVPTSCEQGVCGTCLTRVFPVNPPSGFLPYRQGEASERSIFATLNPSRITCLTFRTSHK
nr:2Fe-2S iron-sulfur cluster binding domain-containing protein [Paraburkholderia sp. RAU2J]